MLTRMAVRRWRVTMAVFAIAAAVPAFSPVAPAAAEGPVPVVFDTDMDYDDAAALAYLSQEHKRGRISLRAVTVTNSGVGLPGLAIRNARCLLQRFGLGHVPVADGSPTAPHSAPPELRLAVELVMSTVLLGCLASTSPAPVSAAQLLVDTIRSAPSDVVLVATGPVSNVAAALRLDAERAPSTPPLSERLAGVYVMGGAIHVPGNLCCTTILSFDGSQELNIWVDPAAAMEVFASLPSGSVSLIPLDATRHVPMTTTFAERLRADQGTPEAQVVAAIATHPLVTLPTVLGMAYWWDPLAAMAAIRPGTVSYEDLHVAVVQDGPQSGRTAPSADGPALRAGTFADRIRFEQVFIDTLNGRLTAGRSRPAPGVPANERMAQLVVRRPCRKLAAGRHGSQERCGHGVGAGPSEGCRRVRLNRSACERRRYRSMSQEHDGRSRHLRTRRSTRPARRSGRHDHRRSGRIMSPTKVFARTPVHA